MKLPDLPPGVAVLTPRRILPRRGLADPAWTYVPADQTDIAKTIRAERARLSAQGGVDALDERAAVRAAIAEMCDAPADVPLPMPAWQQPHSVFARPWQPLPNRRATQSGRLDTDTAVALAAVAMIGAACRFAGLFS